MLPHQLERWPAWQVDELSAYLTTVAEEDAAHRAGVDPAAAAQMEQNERDAAGG